MKRVKYLKDGNAYYKVNNELKRITKIEDNVVEYLNYDSEIDRINAFKGVRMEVWKNIENSFFISRHFTWEHQGRKFTTTDKPLNWEKDLCGRKAIVFHNGKIWEANDYYYPRISLTRIESPFGKILDDTKKLVEETVSNMSEEDKKNVTEAGKQYAVVTHSIQALHRNQKWTDIKYCRNFEQI
jgi:hypothetical protein